MEDVLGNVLKVGVHKLERDFRGGCINSGSVYGTDDHRLIFVKENRKPGSDKMFTGEVEGLKAIRNTKTVLAPRPIASGVTNNNKHFIIMEYFNMVGLDSKTSAELGSQLADMHLFNLRGEQPAVNQFGFHVDTSCGFLPQDNTWTDDWITFFRDNRLGQQVQMLQSRAENNWKKLKITEEYWPQLKEIIPRFFEGIEIKPSLVHGDLWSGNSAQCNSKPVLFDPACFYGHHEYDIASTTLFGGYSRDFHEAYFRKIPKSPGFGNRMLLYHLFHYLNHWNHFGGGYESSAVNMFEVLLRSN